VAVGGITYFAADPLVAMVCTSVPVALMSNFFVSTDDAANFAPYFVVAVLLLLLYSITYYVLVQFFRPCYAALVVFAVASIVSVVVVAVRNAIKC